MLDQLDGPSSWGGAARFAAQQAEESGGRGFAPAARSKFRRKREPEAKAGTEASNALAAEPASQAEALAEEERTLRHGRGISSLYDTKALSRPPAVLVDGYNVLMLWLREPSERARKRRVQGDFEAARAEILRDLSEYSGFRSLRMMVAFDAQGNPASRGIARDQVGGVETVFVGEGEADSFIIGEARQLRKSGCPYVLVASSDNDISDACWNDEIFPISAAHLLREVRRAKKEADDFQRESLNRMRTDRVGYSLMRRNPSLYARLEKARVRQTRS